MKCFRRIYRAHPFGLLLVCLIFFTSPSKAEVLTPSAFEWITNTGIDIMRAYRHGVDLMDQHRSIFLFDIDVIASSGREYTIPTIFGDGQVTVGQYDCNFYWNFLRQEDLLLGIVSSFSLTALSGSVYAWNPEDRDYDSYSWAKGSVVAGVRTVWQEHMSFCLGVWVKSSPYTETLSTGEEVFSVYYDEESEYYREQVISSDLFLQTDLYGFDLGTLLSFTSGSLDQIDLQYPFALGDDLGYISPTCSYYQFRDTVRVGVIQHNFRFIPRLQWDNELQVDVAKRNLGSSLAYALTVLLVEIIREPNADPGTLNRDRIINLKLAGSFSRDLFSEDLWGGLMEIAWENVKWQGAYFRFALGMSKNYIEALYRNPLQNDTFIHLDLRMAID